LGDLWPFAPVILDGAQRRSRTSLARSAPLPDGRRALPAAPARRPSRSRLSPGRPMWRRWTKRAAFARRARGRRPNMRTVQRTT